MNGDPKLSEPQTIENTVKDALKRIRKLENQTSKIGGTVSAVSSTSAQGTTGIIYTKARAPKSYPTIQEALDALE